MESLIIPVLIGIILIVLGVMNRKGNIDTLHSYHRKRVREEDRLPFGRKVGTGTIIIGCALIAKACLEFAAGQLKMPVMDTIGSGILIAGLAAGFAIIIRAMFRYNKGVF
ncbi:MAG: hypothetical protein K6G61_04735 [Solobacterium sp.]|nr:hypothetical protein [Solobacterium sp.]